MSVYVEILGILTVRRDHGNEKHFYNCGIEYSSESCAHFMTLDLRHSYESPPKIVGIVYTFDIAIECNLLPRRLLSASRG